MLIPNRNYLKRESIFRVALIAFLLVPSAVWIYADKGMWRGDPVGYALWAAKLYGKLTTDLNSWILGLFEGTKAPLLVWIGHLFVGLGYGIGNVSFALLLVPFVCNFATLFFLFRSAETLFGSKILSVCCALLAIGSPLYNGIMLGFWVEPLQVAIVSWFIYMLVNAANYSFYHALVRFILAISIAALSKVSTVLYIVVPSVVFWLVVLKSHLPYKRKKYDLWLLFFSILLFVATIVFYSHNLYNLLGFAKFASTNALFGSEHTRLRLCYENISNGIFSAFSFGVACIIICFAISRLRLSRVDARIWTVIFATVLQLSVFLFAWFSSTNADPRYFLPMLPYFSLLICWGVSVIDCPTVTFLSIVAFFIQFLLVTSFSFRIVDAIPPYGLIRQFSVEHTKEEKMIYDLIALSNTGHSIVLDLQPEMGAAEFEFEYIEQTGGLPDSINVVDVTFFFNAIVRQEIDTNKLDAQRAWENMLASKPDFYVTWRSRLSIDLIEKEMMRIDRYNAQTLKQRWAVATKVKNCESFEEVPTYYPNLLVYKRRDIVLKQVNDSQLFKL